MSRYSIYISDNRVAGDSIFYLIAYTSLEKEYDRLCNFISALDDDLVAKRNCILEYNRAKYRRDAVNSILKVLHFNNTVRKIDDCSDKHYLAPWDDEIFVAHKKYLALYEAAPENEKPDYSLYYTISAIIQKQTRDLEATLANVTDDEKKIECEEGIGGLLFAKECVDNAWKNRYDVAMREKKNSDFLKLLADETRLKMINILMAKDATAEEIAKDLSLTKNTINSHLKKMESNGIVTCYFSGMTLLYSINYEIFRTPLEELIKKDPQTFQSQLIHSTEIVSRFFKDGRLIQLPAQREKREIVLREIAKRFTPGCKYDEKSVNRIIEWFHPDYCTIRREMISFGIMARDKEKYWLL